MGSAILVGTLVITLIVTLLNVAMKHGILKGTRPWRPRVEDRVADKYEPKMEYVCELPNGCSLFRQVNEVGGHRYISDEVGGGVVVWDTCLVDHTTILVAVNEELKVWEGVRNECKC